MAQKLMKIPFIFLPLLVHWIISQKVFTYITIETAPIKSLPTFTIGWVLVLISIVLLFFTLRKSIYLEGSALQATVSILLWIAAAIMFLDDFACFTTYWAALTLMAYLDVGINVASFYRQAGTGQYRPEQYDMGMSGLSESGGAETKKLSKTRFITGVAVLSVLYWIVGMTTTINFDTAVIYHIQQMGFDFKITYKWIFILLGSVVTFREFLKSRKLANSDGEVEFHVSMWTFAIGLYLFKNVAVFHTTTFVYLLAFALADLFIAVSAGYTLAIKGVMADGSMLSDKLSFMKHFFSYTPWLLIPFGLYCYIRYLTPYTLDSEIPYRIIGIDIITIGDGLVMLAILSWINEINKGVRLEGKSTFVVDIIVSAGMTAWMGFLMYANPEYYFRTEFFLLISIYAFLEFLFAVLNITGFAHRRQLRGAQAF